MKKLLLLTFATFIAVGSLSAQDKCGTKTPHQLVKERTDLSEQEKAKILEEYKQIDTYYKKLSDGSINYKRSDSTYIIPIVFHIIHENGEENVPNEYIQYSVDLMNAEFNAENEAVDDVVAPFKDRVGDANIRFVLATKRPDGSCTGGIERYYDPELTNCPDIECNLRAKAKYHWPRDKYMNFYVVKSVASGVGGFSFFPFDYPQNGYFASQDSLDGNSVTAASLSTSPTDVARSVCSHEAGHWFGLYHTWGKTDNVDLPENCDEDDEVDDTPNCKGLTSCSLSANSCDTGTDDEIDNAQNYMDYAGCRAMFTQGQADRMRSILENVPFRRNLWQPENLAETGADYEGDLEGICTADFTTSYDFNASGICAGSSVTFSDQSTHTVESRKWIFEGATPMTSTEKEPTVTYENPGKYGVTLVIYSGTDSLMKVSESIITVEDKGDLFALTEDFEEETALDNFLVKSNEFGWKHTTETSYDGTGAVYINNYDGPANESYIITSHTFDFTGQYVLQLSFNYAFARTSSTNIDEVRVQVSTDCGLTWNTRRTLKGSSLSTTDIVSGEAFVPSTEDDWKQFNLNLSSYGNTNGFKFRLVFNSGEGNNLYLDNLNLDVAPSVGETQVKKATLVPNPASSSFQIENMNWEYLQVLDITGKQVIEQAAVQGNSVDVSTLEFGTYSVRLTAKNGTSQVIKLLKAK